jgi:hypothetical protein
MSFRAACVICSISGSFLGGLQAIKGVLHDFEDAKCCRRCEQASGETAASPKKTWAMAVEIAPDASMMIVSK